MQKRHITCSLMLAIASLMFLFVVIQTAIAQDNLPLITEPADGNTPIINAINNAKKSIDLEVYMLNNEEIKDALIAAQKRKVKVRVILERNPWGGGNDPTPFYNDLTAGGVAVHWSSDKFVFTHEKAMVVDGTAAYIATFNYTDNTFEYDRDYAFIDHDKADIKQIEQVFYADWMQQMMIIYSSRLVWSPGSRQDILLNVINSAQHTLLIEAEELVDRKVIQALYEQTKKGVMIYIILPKDNLSLNERALIQAGVKLRMSGVYPPNHAQLYMHAKIIIADGKTMFLGSENLSANSFDNNRELGIILHASDSNDVGNVIQKINNNFDSDWDQATDPPPPV
jgi:cardiolipin synthase A/B